MLILFIAIGLTLPPLLFARWAWRARRSVRVGTHPHCDRCDHNLFGLPETSERCPECGGDLREARAVVAGAPRANRVIVVTATVFTTVLIAVAGRAWREVEWMPVRLYLTPTSWLIRETALGGPTGSRAAEELERRVQADWYEDESLERVMRALWPVKFQVRPTVRAGAELPIEIEHGPPISAAFRSYDPRDPPPSSRYCVFARFDRYQIGDGPWVSGGQWRTPQHVRAVGWRTEAAGIPAAAEKGQTTLRVVFAMRLVMAARTDGIALDVTGSPYTRPLTPDEPAALVWEERVDVPVTIVPQQGSDVELVIDPELRQVVQAALPPAIGLAFDVFLRDEASGVEASLGSITRGPRGGSRSAGYASPPATSNVLDRFSGPTADIILRPSLDKARQTTDLLKIWGEEVVIKDVPVVRDFPPPPATTQP